MLQRLPDGLHRYVLKPNEPPVLVVQAELYEVELSSHTELIEELQGKGEFPTTGTAMTGYLGVIEGEVRSLGALAILLLDGMEYSEFRTDYERGEIFKQINSAIASGTVVVV